MEKRASRVRSGGGLERPRAARASSVIVRLGCSHASSPPPGQGHLLARPRAPQTSPGRIELECCSMAGKANLRKKIRHIPVDKPHTRPFAVEKLSFILGVNSSFQFSALPRAHLPCT